MTTGNLSLNAIMQQISSLAYSYMFDLMHEERYPVRSVGGYALLANVVSSLKKMIKKKNSLKLPIEIGPPETFFSYLGFNGMSDHANSTIPKYSSSMV
ncbi:hypothetical protein N7451_009428 [Penicillium sp. IBT 35674x]|nr:hypothetical protein N7451_009428 [Penicillium sp. IBT 35674x]